MQSALTQVQEIWNWLLPEKTGHVMRWLRQLTLAELLTIIAIVAVFIALINPDFPAMFDHNPDNTFPISVMLPDFSIATNGKARVQVLITGLETDAEGSTDVYCVLMNTGTEPVYYQGYAPTYFPKRLTEGKISPRIERDTLKDGKWEELRIRGCGTGLTQRQLKPGHAGRFRARRTKVPSDIRIGVHCVTSNAGKWSRDSIVWSEPIPFLNDAKSAARADRFCLPAMASADTIHKRDFMCHWSENRTQWLRSSGVTRE